MEILTSVLALEGARRKDHTAWSNASPILSFYCLTFSAEK